jgi:hypothetical protein
MKSYVACALVMSCLSAPTVAQTAVPGAESADAPVQVVVEGRRPGPGVWKVSKDGHVMWLFGLYSPLPKKMEWDDARVERLVKQSQELLLPPNFHAGISGAKGILRGLMAVPSLIGADKIPDGATLHDVLPADAYARWTLLKEKYIGKEEGVEHLRPMFAAERLMSAGLDKNGLTKGEQVFGRIVEIAKVNKVKQTSTGIHIELDDPRKLVRDFKQMQVQDQACFISTLDGLEGDIAAMQERANAWANGNIAEIGKLDFAKRDACADAKLNNPAVRSVLGYDNVTEHVWMAWVQSAEKALADNTSTFAMLQMKNILGPNGVLVALQAKGYTVESPK